MATKKLGTFNPFLLVLFVNVAASSGLQSGLLSNLLKANSHSNNPIVVALDKNDLAKLGSENRDSDFVDVEQRNRKPLVYLYQMGQSRNAGDRSNSGQWNRQRKQQYRDSQYRYNRPRYEHRHIKDRKDRHRHEYQDRYQPRDRYQSRDRHRNDRYVRYNDRYSRPLRTDDKKQEQVEKELIEQETRDRNYREQNDRERTDRDEQDRGAEENVTHEKEREENKSFKGQDSARAQIPVLRSLLRTLSCNARDECQDTCDGPEKNECEDECEEQYECKDEEEENDSCDTCDEKTTQRPKCTGSTRGERLVTETPKCKRC